MNYCSEVANLETLLTTERGITAELRRDKESIQKQLELVTLRLPAPKVGFCHDYSAVGERREIKRKYVILREFIHFFDRLNAAA